MHLPLLFVEAVPCSSAPSLTATSGPCSCRVHGSDLRNLPMWTNSTYLSTAAARSLAFGVALLVAVVILVHTAVPAAAQGSGFLPRDEFRASEGFESGTWRNVQNGDVLPLETVLGIARREIGGGTLLDVDLNNRSGVYRLEMLRPDDSVVYVFVDGRSGRVIRVRG